MTKPETANNNAESQENPPEEMLELKKPGVENIEINKLAEDNAQLKDQLLRALADAENARKRAEKDIEDAGKYAIGSFARDLINVLENLVRAEQNIPAEATGNAQLKNFIDGIAMTQKELLAAFEKHGIKRLDPMGEKFDHNFHQAVAEVESDQPPGMVANVMQAGYTIRDRLLRPAMVAVSKAGEKPAV